MGTDAETLARALVALITILGSLFVIKLASRTAGKAVQNEELCQTRQGEHYEEGD